MPVEDLLTSKGVQYKSSGSSLLIRCLNPEHPDNNPSCRVDKVTGATHCFSCGFSANIFRHYGILNDTVSLRVVKLKEKLAAFMETNSELVPIKGLVPFQGAFRGISAKTLKTFNAMRTYDDPDFTDRIIIPITDISGRVYSYIARHMFSDEHPRYVIYPRKRAVSLFPIRLPANTSKVVLVEGIFDMLNLYDSGMTNVVCCFGTQGITEKTVVEKTLPLKIQGVSKVFILFDGDKPGRDAAAATKPLLEEVGLSVEILELEDDTDPGNLDLEHIRQIKEYTS